MENYNVKNHALINKDLQTLQPFSDNTNTPAHTHNIARNTLFPNLPYSSYLCRFQSNCHLCGNAG